MIGLSLDTIGLLILKGNDKFAIEVNKEFINLEYNSNSDIIGQLKEYTRALYHLTEALQYRVNNDVLDETTLCLYKELERRLGTYIDDNTIDPNYLPPPGEIIVPIGTIANTFLLLTDTPDSYSGKQGYLVQVDYDSMGLQFIDPSLLVGVDEVNNGLSFDTSTGKIPQLGGGDGLIQSTHIITNNFDFLVDNLRITKTPSLTTDVVRLQDLYLPDSIVSGLGLTLVSTNVVVASGSWRIHNLIYSKGTSTTLAVDAQDATLSRFDAVYATTTNTIGVVSGTLSASPDIPSIPGGTLLIGTILITPTSVTTGIPPTTTYIDTTTVQTISITGQKTFLYNPILSDTIVNPQQAVNGNWVDATYQRKGKYVQYDIEDAYDFNLWTTSSFGTIDNQSATQNGPNGNVTYDPSGAVYALINHKSFDRGLQIAANVNPGSSYPGNQISWRGGKSVNAQEWNSWYDFYHTGNLDTSTFLLKSGGTMTGSLVLSGDPTTALGAATKQYVDNIGIYFGAGQLTGSGTLLSPFMLGNTAITGQPLTGLSLSTGGTISSTDTILVALGKLQNEVTTGGGGGTGTVTSVSIVTANGFTGSVATATTTPAVTLTLQNATTSQSGQLTSTDWNTFNNKQAAGSYLTANQTITLTGGVTGSGTTTITTTLATGVVGISNLSATGTASSSTYLRGDNTWATVSGGGITNPMTTAGDIIIGGVAGAPARLAGQTTIARGFLSQTESGGTAAAPAWFDLFGTANTWSANQSFTGTAMSLTNSQNAATIFTLSNTNTGASAASELFFRNDNGSGNTYMSLWSNAASAFGPFTKNSLNFYNDQNGGFAFFVNTSGSGASIRLMTANQTGITVSNSGRVLLNTSTDDALNFLQVNGTARATQFITHASPTAVNSTATLTVAQMGTGYITSTSAAAVTMTTATATALATQLVAIQGTWYDLTIDNTAGANTVTLALGSGFTLLNDITGSTTLTVPSGTAGIATWRITFVSATAATISRIQ